ncbi:MAG: hypothetical protein J6Z04_03385 [Clostridia bacterium]|nr:hypothetical protein [Clostridia bacterium]
MMKLHFDFTETTGKIKPMHAVGQPPADICDDGIEHSMFHYLTEANIPYSRLHDTGGCYGANVFVDVPNLFRDFDADENDPASYDFAFTDALLEKMVEAKLEPYFRLGVTIENAHMIKSYRIFPPKDPEKWARIAEHIVRHYNEGWANGFHFGITYWEVWNEPDNEESIELNNMWKGTKEQYYDLYVATAKRLKDCFGDSIKVGGYANTGLYLGYMEKEEKYQKPHEVSHWEARAIYHTEFLRGFLRRVKREGAPLDFFSHHSYLSVERTKDVQAYAEKILSEEGFPDIEIHLNEWNTDRTLATRGTTKAAADVIAMMIAMQRTKMSLMCYYDARFSTSVYAGLFNPLTEQPFCTYYAFKAFGKLYALGNAVESTGDGDGVYALAATDGKTRGVLITNIGEEKTVETDLGRGYTAYRIDEKHPLTKTRVSTKSVKLKQFDTLYFEKID